MKVVADKKIPFLSDFFGREIELCSLSEDDISPERLQDADALLVRSVTTVGPTLLQNTPIQFVGSATAGIDHLDIHYFQQQGIAWAHAPGCNAAAVADYVLLSVVELIHAGLLPSSRDGGDASLRAGVIGAGQVGSRVSAMLRRLGFAVIENDPPRATVEEDFQSTPLSAFYDGDLICVHTPLTTTGPYPTHRLINNVFLSKLKAGCVLLNAGRGAVIDGEALKQATQLVTVLDVWEHEPDIDVALAQSAFIATPHIAGYSRPAKFRATCQLFHAFCDFFNITRSVEPIEEAADFIRLDLLTEGWIEQVLRHESLKALSDEFKRSLARSDDVTQSFNLFRKHYSFRKEFRNDLPPL